MTCDEEPLPGVGNGLPADRRDELDGKLVLLGIDVTFVWRKEKQNQPFKDRLGAEMDKRLN